MNERFYVLDEGYKLILAPPPASDDPMNAFYEATSATDALPPLIDDTVRKLTNGWDRRSPSPQASEVVEGLRVTVEPLQGPIGPHYAVRIERDRRPSSATGRSAA